MKKGKPIGLQNLLDAFDPLRPLEDQELDRYYVERPHAPLEQLKTYLRGSAQPVKVLFSGHRGSGKSTEFRRLSRDLDEEFFVVHASVRKLLSDLKYVDVVLAALYALVRDATDQARGARIPPALGKDLLEWLTKEISSTSVVKVPKTGAIHARLNAYVFTMEAKYGREAETRIEIRERLSSRIT